MKTKYYRQDGKIVRCTDLKTFNNTEDFLLDEVRKLEKDQTNLERQLAEASEERDYLATGIQVRDNMIRSLQEECVKLQLQIPIEPFKIEIKEKG